MPLLVLPPKRYGVPFHFSIVFTKLVLADAGTGIPNTGCTAVTGLDGITTGETGVACCLRAAQLQSIIANSTGINKYENTAFILQHYNGKLASSHKECSQTLPACGNLNQFSVVAQSGNK